MNATIAIGAIQANNDARWNAAVVYMGFFYFFIGKFPALFLILSAFIGFCINLLMVGWMSWLFPLDIVTKKFPPVLQRWWIVMIMWTFIVSAVAAIISGNLKFLKFLIKFHSWWGVCCWSRGMRLFDIFRDYCHSLFGPFSL
jgi:hypothetical protein